MTHLDLASDGESVELRPNSGETERQAKAANEDSPSGGALYRLIARRPSRRIPAIASAATLLVLVMMAAFVWGFLGSTNTKVLAPHEMGLIAGLALIPVILIWLAAFTIWRGSELHLMADALARTAIRLTSPADAGSEEIATIASAMRRELDGIKAGIAGTVAEATRLRTILSKELDAIETGTDRAERRAAHMEELLSRHRGGLAELGRSLGAESDTVARGLREQVESVRGLIGEAQATLQSTGLRVVTQTETLVRASEAARNGGDATATALERQASRLEVVAGDALGKASELAARYETQRQVIAAAADRLEAERGRLEALFDAQRENLAEADQNMMTRTAEMTRTTGTFTNGLNAAIDMAAARAGELRNSISAEVARAAVEVTDASNAISRSAGAATRAIGATVEELRAATAALGDDVTRAATETIANTTDDIRIATAAMTHEVNQSTEMLTSEISTRMHELRGLVGHLTSENDISAERFNAAMIRLGGAAKDAGRALNDATIELEERIARMPADAAASASSLNNVLHEQVSALATIADVVVRHARALDRSAAPQDALPAYEERRMADVTSMPPPMPERRMSGTRAQPGAAPARRWGISDLLSAAGRSPEAPLMSAPRDHAGDLPPTSLQVIETLQALAVDLDRALEQSPPADLWQRYQAGERNVFTRRLYNISGRQLYDRIAVKYRAEAEFRDHVDRFAELFERLLSDSAARDRDNILVETYLTSDTGKVYLILAQASGRLV